MVTDCTGLVVLTAALGIMAAVELWRRVFR